MHLFVSNKLFGQILIISPKHFIVLKTFKSDFLFIQVWFTEQNSKPKKVEDKMNITLVINQYKTYKKCHVI